MRNALSRRTILPLTVCIAACSSAPTRPESVGRGDYTKVAEYVSALVRREMKKGVVTGLSIALVDDQRVVWAEGFGFADKAGNVPASPETIYRAGSISKLFTATAAMQLAERGSTRSQTWARMRSCWKSCVSARTTGSFSSIIRSRFSSPAR